MLKFEFKKWFCINCKSLMLFVQHWHLVVGWQTHWMASEEIVLKLLYLSSFLLHWWRSQMFHFEWMHFYVIQWFHLLEKNSIKQEIFFENKGYKFTILPNFKIWAKNLQAIYEGNFFHLFHPPSSYFKMYTNLKCRIFKVMFRHKSHIIRKTKELKENHFFIK
jgi:hypothetical protein